MKYRTATELLPDKLLEEVQKYASGELIYVPKREERREWGVGTGARAYYSARNDEIRWKYHHDKRKLSELADEYSLSIESIRRILYK